jgi:hypothetical protein
MWLEHGLLEGVVGAAGASVVHWPYKKLLPATTHCDAMPPASFFGHAWARARGHAPACSGFTSAFRRLRLALLPAAPWRAGRQQAPLPAPRSPQQDSRPTALRGGSWLSGCAVFLLKAPLGYQGSRSWATFKKCGPRAVLSRLSASSGGPGCSQGKKRVFKNRFQSNNNRFKPLLQKPPLFQLRLTILTKQGCEECTRDS